MGGASAGANLAAGAVLRLHDQDAWLPAGLLLVYPMLHPEIPTASKNLAAALAELPEPLRMSPADCEHLTTNYLGGPAGTADGYAMPGFAALDGLCPTLVINAEYDGLRACGEAFTAVLALAGVDVRQVCVPGMVHGFLNLPSELAPVGMALKLMAGVVAAPLPADH